MVKFLSQEWLDLQKELGAEFPERPARRRACSTS